jgi:hypothetical protein
MLELGVFGGKYMTDCAAEFPAAWFRRAKLCRERHDARLNYFKVNASKPLWYWRQSMTKTRAAGFNGIAATTWAGDVLMMIGRSRAGEPSTDMSRSYDGTVAEATSPAGRGSAKRYCNGRMTRENSEP